MHVADLTDPTDPLIVTDAAAWRAWLDEHEAVSEGVWLVMAKKGTASPTSLSYADALQEALCSGWIDGQRRSRDDATFLQRFTPRRRGSVWSVRNTKYVTALIVQGRMRPRGQAEVDLAMRDGRWERAYEGPATAEVPADLAESLANSPAAAARFAALNSSDRYSVLHPIMTARTPTVRSNRIMRAVDRLAGEGAAD